MRVWCIPFIIRSMRSFVQQLRHEIECFFKKQRSLQQIVIIKYQCQSPKLALARCVFVWARRILMSWTQLNVCCEFWLWFVLPCMARSCFHKINKNKKQYFHVVRHSYGALLENNENSGLFHGIMKTIFDGNSHLDNILRVKKTDLEIQNNQTLWTTHTCVYDYSSKFQVEEKNEPKIRASLFKWLKWVTFQFSKFSQKRQHLFC